MVMLGWLRDKKPYFSKHGLPICLSAAIPLAVYFLVMLHYGVQISKATFLLDFCFLGYASALFFLFQKNKHLAVVPFVIVITILFLAAIQKYVMLKVWIRFSDLSLLDEAWQVLPLTYRLTLLFLVVLTLGITVYNRQLPHLRALLLFIPLAFAATLTACAPGYVVRGLRNTTHAVFGNDPLYRSVFFAIAYDLADRLAFEQESATLLSRHGSESASVFSSDKIQRKRNIHMFVLESFMDPMLLGIPLPDDPFDRRIRENLGGYSLSPVFGGRTSQAEFELLCGTPVYDFLDPVTFNDLRGAPIDCLPTLLRANGYVTLSSTDVPGSFFNMREAYKSLGFSQSYFRDAFPTTDMDGLWISADEHIANNKRLIGPLLESEQPFLNYVLFVTGHSPYELNPKKRPQVLRTGSTDEVTRFVNAVYYNTRSIADYIDWLVENDPDALIVLVGDHQGALPSISRQSDWSQLFELERYLTPYLFLDAGEAKRYGDIAHFDIPHIIIQSLHGVAYSPMVQRYGVDLIRPFGQQAFYRYEGEDHLCPNGDDPRCAAVDEFRKVTVATWLRLIQQSRTKSP